MAPPLTQAGTNFQSGTAFWPTPVNTEGLTASFTATIGGGGAQGADGMTLVLADPSTSPTAVGYYGGGLGFSGIKGIAVCIDTYQTGSDPSSNFVGISNGPVSSSVPDQLNWLATQTVVPDLRGTNSFTVTLDDGVLTVNMDGAEVLSTTVNIGPDAADRIQRRRRVGDRHPLRLGDVDPLRLTPPSTVGKVGDGGRRGMARADGFRQTDGAGRRGDEVRTRLRHPTGGGITWCHPT